MATDIDVKSSTFTVTENVASGLTIDGCGYVVAGAGTLTLGAPTPGVTQDGNGNDMNGSMLNPQYVPLGQFPEQAFDERMNAIKAGNAKYNAALAPSYPITVSAGDIIVHTVGHDFETGGSNPLGSNDNRVRFGILSEVNVLYVVDAAPGAEEFPPGIWGWSGRGTPSFESPSDTLDNIVAALPNYPLAGIPAPTATEILGFFDHFDPFFGRKPGTDWKKFESYEVSSVRKGYSNYGREFGALVGAAGLMMISDGLNAAQKKTMLIRNISQGRNWVEARIANNNVYGGNGGHFQKDKIPAGFAVKYTSIGVLPDLNNIVPGNCLAQAFEVTQSMLDNDFVPNDGGTNHPWPWRRATIASVNGNDVTLNSSTPTFQCRGLVLTRESDGDAATVTSQGNQQGTITLDAQPTPPFAVGQTVYFDAPWLVAGQGEWNIQAQNRVSYLPEYNPSPDANYRSLNNYDEEVLVMRAAGLWDSLFDKMEDLVVKSKQANYPTAVANWPDHNIQFDSNNFGLEFWNAHSATILAGGTGSGQAPVIAFTNPTDNTLMFPVDGVFEATLDKACQLVTGSIVLRQDSGGWADLEVFNVSTGNGDNGGSVAIVGNKLTIIPGADLAHGTEYAIRIDGTAIDDTESPANSFAGIADDTTWSVTTALALPLLPASLTLSITVPGG